MPGEIRKIEGTSMVIKDNTVYKTIVEKEKTFKTVCLCCFCGEKFGANASGQCAIYCKNCKTKKQRDDIQAENDVINNK